VLKRAFLPATLLIAALTTHVHAQEVDDATRSAARQLATQGSEAYEAQNYAAAYDRFNRAYQLVSVPTVGIWSARSLVKLGRWVEASERYLEIERTPLAENAPPEHAKAREEAAAERRDLLAKLPQIRVLIEGAEVGDVFVTLNGKVLNSALVGVNNPVDPGTLKVKAVRGEDVVDATVQIAERQVQDVKLVFKPVEAAPGATAPEATPETERPGVLPPAVTPDTSGGSGQRTLSYVALGLGGVGLAVGATFGIIAMGDKGDLDDKCNADRQCGPELADDVDSYDTSRTISSIGLIGGAVLVGAGAVLYFTAGSDDPKEEQARVGAFFNGQQIGLTGRFQ
jgi:hypothetical protein